MTKQSSHTMRRGVALALGLALAAGGATTLTGCAPDERPAAIEAAVTTALGAAPYLPGATVGDVAAAVSSAGKKPASIAVPIRLPDLGAAAKAGAEDAVIARITPGGPYQSPLAAAQALAGLSQTAWQDWLAANAATVPCATVTVPVSTSQKRGQPVAVSIDEAALRAALLPYQKTNVRLYVEAVQALPAWQETIIAQQATGFARTITGLPRTLLDQVKLTGVEPLEQNAFTVTLSYPDPAAVVAYQVETARQGYGDGKIFDGVTPEDLRARAETVTDIPATLETTPVTGQAVLEMDSPRIDTVDVPGAKSIDIADTLEAHLDRLIDRYRVHLRDGSYTVPSLDEAWTTDVNAAVERLRPQFVMPVDRPGTSRLVGGGSGQPMKLTAQGEDDLHITFFTWGTSNAVVSAFVKAGESINLRVPTGSYHLVYASGETWYGPGYSFGPTGNYAEAQEDDARTAKAYTVSGGYQYQLTFQPATGGNASAGSTDNPFPT